MSPRPAGRNAMTVTLTRRVPDCRAVITAQIRVHWPAAASTEMIEQALHGALGEVARRLREDQ